MSWAPELKAKFRRDLEASRGDRTAIELFPAELSSWEVSVKRLIELHWDGKYVPHLIPRARPPASLEQES